MRTSTIAAGIAAAVTLSIPSAALAAADVTVRVEGQTVKGPAAAVTAADSFSKDGNTCAGPSYITALEAATAGNWSGTYFSSFGSYSVDAIRGEAHPFGSGSYWSVYVNGRGAFDGCTPNSVRNGDEVVFAWTDDGFADGVAGYEGALFTRVAAARVAPGTAFTVDVTESTDDAPVASAGATVKAGGVTATSGANGKATLTLTERGPVELVSTKGNKAPDRDTLCVTDGADGFCGTTKPGQPATPQQQDASTTPPPTASSPCRTTGSDGRCGSPDKLPTFGFITSLKEGATFRAGKGPRTLAGEVAEDPSGVRQVTLRLTRNDKGRCAYYSGKKEIWVKTRRCSAKAGFFFKAAETANWSYLLPEKLGSGRYVFDVRATDRAGNADLKLDRGRNRVVFRVG